MCDFYLRECQLNEKMIQNAKLFLLKQLFKNKTCNTHILGCWIRKYPAVWRALYCTACY